MKRTTTVGLVVPPSASSLIVSPAILGDLWNVYSSFLLSIRNMAQLERWNCRETLVSSLARRVFLTDFPNFVSDTKRRVVTAFPLLGSLLYLFIIALIP